MRVIAPDGTQIGIKPINEALEIAASYGLDLVEIAPQSTPPVCKIIDYSKFKYEQEKRKKELLKKERLSQVKEMWFTPQISPHDYEFKIDHVKEFLTKGRTVRVVISLSDKVTNKSLNNIIEKIKNDTKELFTSLSERSETNRYIIVIHPKKK